MLLTASPDSMQPVEALLDVAAYPDQAISSISFNFWHRLMRQLTSGFSGPEAAPGANQESVANAHNAVSVRHNLLFTFGGVGRFPLRAWQRMLTTPWDSV